MKKQHGGARPGAGRKPSEIPTVPVSARIPEELADRLDSKAHGKGLRRSAAILAAIKRWVGR